MRKLALLLALAVGLLAVGAVTVLGKPRSRAGRPSATHHLDVVPAGRAVAFAVRVKHAGTVGSAEVFIDSRTKADSVRVGLYRSHHGHPGTRLAAGLVRGPRSGAWNRVGLGGARLARGGTYWLAILGTGGRLAYRDRVSRSCHNQQSAAGDLRRLPRSWTPGATRHACSLAAHLTIATSRPHRRPLPTPKPKPMTHCISRLAECGYPDAGGNDGAHGKLTPVKGTVVLDRAGEVFQNKDVSGGILVRANNVTIHNVQVTADGGEGIEIYSGDTHVPIDGTTITDTTVRGAAPTSGDAVSDGILNAGGNTNTTATRLYIYNSESTGWNGPGAVSDSHLIVDTFAEGAHDEAVYEPGGDAGAQLRHDTLLNNQPQTAVVFFSVNGGRGQHDSVSDSLMAGGGYLVYGAHGPTDPPPIDGPHITDNRIARSPYGGYFREGGSAGVAVAIDWSTDWSGNYWDDDLKPVG